MLRQGGEGKYAMCNLYSMTRPQDAMRRLFRLTQDSAGNLPPMPAIFPDQMAPVIVAGPEGGRELTTMRWGLPGPAQYGGAPITNVRNTASSYWRPWLGVAHRCLVPFTAFCEYADTKPRKTPVWFALDEERPLACFAGIWTTWHGTRGPKANPVTGAHRLFGFLTSEANALVAPVHPKAMPVVLATPEEWDIWLKAPPGEALALQRPAPDGLLREVARGPRQDDGASLA